MLEMTNENFARLLRGLTINLRCENPEPTMSALGQKQTSEHVRVMSALPPIADIAERNRHVRFVLEAAIHRTTASCIATPSDAALGTCVRG